jgi:hypothetical protein
MVPFLLVIPNANENTKNIIICRRNNKNDVIVRHVWKIKPSRVVMSLVLGSNGICDPFLPSLPFLLTQTGTLK